MAHKKGAGSSKNGRESHSKRLGVKIFGGQQAIAGNIIVRQRGTKHHPDKGVGIGKDHTLYALIPGIVLFKKKSDNKSYVSVIPSMAEDAAPATKPTLKTGAAKKAVKTEQTEFVAASPKAEKKPETKTTELAE